LADLPDNQKAYWASNLRLIAVLMAIWFAVSFVTTYFARELSFSFFGWPFSFWMASQGALVAYLLIIGFYAWAMNRLDHRHGLAEED
jgi:putative solute:sodium symporter small subunit